MITIAQGAARGAADPAAEANRLLKIFEAYTEGQEAKQTPEALEKFLSRLSRWSDLPDMTESDGKKPFLMVDPSEGELTNQITFFAPEEKSGDAEVDAKYAREDADTKAGRSWTGANLADGAAAGDLAELPTGTIVRLYDPVLKQFVYKMVVDSNTSSLNLFVGQKAGPNPSLKGRIDVFLEDKETFGKYRDTLENLPDTEREKMRSQTIVGYVVNPDGSIPSTKDQMRAVAPQSAEELQAFLKDFIVMHEAVTKDPSEVAKEMRDADPAKADAIFQHHLWARVLALRQLPVRGDTPQTARVAALANLKDFLEQTDRTCDSGSCVSEWALVRGNDAKQQSVLSEVLAAVENSGFKPQPQAWVLEWYRSEQGVSSAINPETAAVRSLTAAAPKMSPAPAKVVDAITAVEAADPSQTRTANSKNIQYVLHALGFYAEDNLVTSRSDSPYGEITTAGVLDFQKAYNRSLTSASNPLVGLGRLLNQDAAANKEPVTTPTALGETGAVDTATATALNQALAALRDGGKDASPIAGEGVDAPMIVATPVYVVPTDITVGAASHPAIPDIRGALIYLGYGQFETSELDVENNGPKTRAALIDFQSKNGLLQTGFYNPETGVKLLAAFNEAVEAIEARNQQIIAGQNQGKTAPEVDAAVPATPVKDKAVSFDPAKPLDTSEPNPFVVRVRLASVAEYLEKQITADPNYNIYSQDPKTMALVIDPEVKKLMDDWRKGELGEIPFSVVAQFAGLASYGKFTEKMTAPVFYQMLFDHAVEHPEDAEGIPANRHLVYAGADIIEQGGRGFAFYARLYKGIGDVYSNGYRYLEGHIDASRPGAKPFVLYEKSVGRDGGGYIEPMHMPDMVAMTPSMFKTTAKETWAVIEPARLKVRTGAVDGSEPALVVNALVHVAYADAGYTGTASSKPTGHMDPLEVSSVEKTANFVFPVTLEGHADTLPDALDGLVGLKAR
ncbi:MAG: peptidoglycan-binding protein, partial [Candidatus Omnitrophica bacterium]|nr:peptidoglycan-binding protein [Candidatus Omnitrophota bacterium]